MPYIKPENRARLMDPDEPVNTMGELTYVLFYNMMVYLEQKGMSYQTLGEITSAADNAKVEFQRRFLAPYEDERLAENGDVVLEEMNENN